MEESSAPKARVAAAAVAVWGGVVLAWYVGAHPELLEIGRGLGEMASAGRGEGPGFVAAAGRAAVGMVVAAAILVACWGFGRAAGRFVPESGLDPALVEGGRFALGLALGAIAVFCAGHVGILTRGLAVALVAAGVVALAATRPRIGGGFLSGRSAEARAARDRGVWPWLALTLAAVPWPLAIALAPPTARDALIYHLAAPKAYVAAGAIVELPANVHAYTPFSTEMLFTWALLLGSEAAAQVLHLIVGAACVALVYAVGAKAGGSPRWGALAAALFATVPSVGWNAGIAHNEMVLALATTVAFLALAGWYQTGRAGALVWFGVALGLALSAKHTLLVMGPVFALIVLLRFRADMRAGRSPAIGAACASAAVALALPAPWYVQNAAWTGNPLYPYFWGLFPTRHGLWSAERAAALDHFLRLSYGRSGAPAAIALPWNVSVLAQNDVPASFDGVLGPALLVLAPVAAWAIVAKWRTIEPSWRVVSGLVGAGFLTWASQSQQVRFLLPIVPAAALVGVVALARTAVPPLVRRATLAIVGVTLAVNVAVTAADVVRADPFRVALGLESRDAYLTRSLAYYELYPILERDVPAGGRVWLVNARADTYNLDVPAFTDTFDEDWTLGDLVNAAATPADVDAAIRARGVTHLLVREDILLSPQYTPFRDEAAVVRWLGFVRERTTTLQRAAPYALYALRTEGTTTPR